MSARRIWMMRVGAIVSNLVQHGMTPVAAISQVINGVMGQIEAALVGPVSLVAVDGAVSDLGAAIVAAYDWARCGFPQLVPSTRLAASMMATHIDSALVPEIAIPWRTFGLVLPPGLMSDARCTAGDGNGNSPADAVAFVMVTRGESLATDLGLDVKRVSSGDFGDHRVMIFGERGGTGTFDFDGLHGLLNTDRQEAADLIREAHVIDTDARDRREHLLFARLIMGLCIELDKKPGTRIAIGQGAPQTRATKRGQPRPWTFELSRDVKVDCRDWIASFLRGEKRGPVSLQTMVRGHHKHQAHGPGGLERKWIHVEPYWRGPEEAPIAVRSHNMKGAAQ